MKSLYSNLAGMLNLKLDSILWSRINLSLDTHLFGRFRGSFADQCYTCLKGQLNEEVRPYEITK